MFENLLLVAIIASILWIGLFGYYIYTSRQSARLEQEISELEELLDETDTPDQPV